MQSSNIDFIQVWRTVLIFRFRTFERYLIFPLKFEFWISKNKVHKYKTNENFEKITINRLNHMFDCTKCIQISLSKQTKVNNKTDYSLLVKIVVKFWWNLFHIYIRKMFLSVSERSGLYKKTLNFWKFNGKSSVRHTWIKIWQNEFFFVNKIF